MNRFCSIAALAYCALFAGWLQGDDFPAPFNAGAGSDEAPLSAEEAAKGFQLPPGFKAQVFASEPEVQNPVAMTWDNRGRLWVAECYTYANRPTRFDLGLRDRVIILNDTDGDGRADERKVFCDNVQQLMSVEVGLGGVWLIALPRLLFIPDRNGDDVPDGPPEVVLDGFETSTENYHNCANGLRWGLDGWLYGRCGASSPGWIGAPGTPKEQRVPIYGGIWRYHPTRKIFEVLCHGFTNPWGHDWDEYGEMFITNTVTGHLFHLIPGAHHTRSATVTPNRRVYDTIDSHADHFHYDNGRGWRATEGDATRDKLGGGHAHCGACIYLGDNWPAEYRGKLLTLNLHGRRINVDAIEREGSGYVARHEPDIALAEDKWFRGIDLNYGPDGAVYIIDWSDTGECHEHDGVHRLSGRVFRISYGDAPVVFASDQAQFAATHLIASHAHKDQWIVRASRRGLADRVAAGRDLSLESLNKFVSSVQGFVKLRALWTLKTLEGVAGQTIDQLINDRDEHVRAWGLRVATDFWPIDTVLGKPQSSPDRIDRYLLPQLIEIAKNDPSGLVRLVLASTLQRLPPADRPALAAALMSHAENANDHNLPKLIWYGLAPLADNDPASLIPLAVEGKLPLTREWITRALAEEPGKNEELLGKLLQQSLVKDESVRADIVRGLVAGLAGRRKVDPPAAWSEFQASFAAADADVQEQVRGLAVLFGDGRALDDVRRIALDDRAKMPQRRAALETLIEARPDDLRQICERLLRVRFLNTSAMKGLTLFDDPALGEQLARNYNSFHPVERPAVIETLASRPAFARALLDQVAAGRIPASDVSAVQARQIRSFGDEALTARLAEVWGELRDSPQDRRELVARLKEELTKDRLATANPSQGRVVFQATCANCHRLFGSGGTIAPDLTGSGRHNLDYLLENIVDPSAVVNKDYRMSVLRMADGRVLNGLITSQDDERVVVQTAKEKLTLMRSEIDEIKLTTLSPMPEGILQPLKPDQIRDLVAYLMSPGQVDLPAGATDAALPATPSR
jgi:putative membrane-bound dehydrogenase-like protein